MARLMARNTLAPRPFVYVCPYHEPHSYHCRNSFNIGPLLVIHMSISQITNCRTPNDELNGHFAQQRYEQPTDESYFNIIADRESSGNSRRLPVKNKIRIPNYGYRDVHLYLARVLPHPNAKFEPSVLWTFGLWFAQRITNILARRATKHFKGLWLSCRGLFSSHRQLL